MAVLMKTDIAAMPLEIERRFLVTGPGWRAHAEEPQHLRQGYLASSEDGFTVRVRLRASCQWSSRAASALLAEDATAA